MPAFAARVTICQGLLWALLKQWSIQHWTSPDQCSRECHPFSLWGTSTGLCMFGLSIRKYLHSNQTSFEVKVPNCCTVGSLRKFESMIDKKCPHKWFSLRASNQIYCTSLPNLVETFCTNTRSFARRQCHSQICNPFLRFAYDHKKSNKQKLFRLISDVVVTPHRQLNQSLSHLAAHVEEAQHYDTVATATCTTILARMILPCCLTKQRLGRFENPATNRKNGEILYQIEWLFDIRALES